MLSYVVLCRAALCFLVLSCVVCLVSFCLGDLFLLQAVGAGGERQIDDSTKPSLLRLSACACNQ